jgi:hypothetical protein
MRSWSSPYPLARDLAVVESEAAVITVNVADRTIDPRQGGRVDWYTRRRTAIDVCAPASEDAFAAYRLIVINPIGAMLLL